jgi:hypothetical protein
MGTLTIPFNFLDLEDVDAEYEHSVEHAVRVASVFQSCAGRGDLGPSFLATRPDPFVSFVQRVEFELRDTVGEESLLRLIVDLARRCRDSLITGQPPTATNPPLGLRPPLCPTPNPSKGNGPRGTGSPLALGTPPAIVGARAKRSQHGADVAADAT